MKITIPPQGKFTRLEDGVYVDEKGNHYHEEKVLRYKVLRQRVEETEDVWQLHSSHSSKQNAMINRDSLEEEEQTLHRLYRYIVKDEGQETTIKRLIY
tara:strand:+ start:4055 stop:4348 length:294 start_codon:yes stop_codon:yes gene_type:complete